MALQSKTIDYSHDGTTLEGYMAWDDAQSAPAPGVLVAHAWAGRDEFECERARQLAQAGYVGFALDVYGKGVLGASAEENGALMGPFMQNRPRLQARLAAALATLRAQPQVQSDKVAAIGYCFGGLSVLDLARSGADVLGVAALHGLLGAPGNTQSTQISAKVLVLHGWDDPMAPPEHVVELGAEMSAAGADWQLHAYGNTVHAFTNPHAADPDFGTVYSADADRRSWEATRYFLHECLGS